jgi:hypothetical protein
LPGILTKLPVILTKLPGILNKSYQGYAVPTD